MAKTTTKPETTFEEDLERLEEVIEEMEGGDLSLEDALARFEEGVRLSRACRTRLETVEGKIQELLENGELRSLTPEEG